MAIFYDANALAALWRDEQNEKHRRKIARRDAEERENYERWINDDELQKHLQAKREADEAELIEELTTAFPNAMVIDDE